MMTHNVVNRSVPQYIISNSDLAQYLTEFEAWQCLRTNTSISEVAAINAK